MSDVENLQKLNADLQNNVLQNTQHIQNLSAQLEAYKGELSDARTISLQLRMNMARYEAANNQLTHRIKQLETEISTLRDAKPVDVPPVPVVDLKPRSRLKKAS